MDKREQEFPGKLLEVELEQEMGRWVYEFEILDDEGIVWELYYDAGTGELVKRELEH